MAKEAAEASKDRVPVVEVVPVVASVATSRERKRSARELPLAPEGRDFRPAKRKCPSSHSACALFAQAFVPRCYVRSAYAAPAAVRPRASLGSDFTVDRIVRSDNPLLTNPRNPKKMNGMVSAKNAKIEKLVAVVFST